MRDALRRLEQDELLREQGAIADPPNAAELLAEAEAALDRGEGTAIRSDEELVAFFRGVSERGRKRLASARKRA